MSYPDDMTKQEIANMEHRWVKSQLEWCDLQKKLHHSQDERAISTIDAIYKYSRDLRSYTTVKDGQAEILIERPVITKC